MIKIIVTSCAILISFPLLVLTVMATSSNMVIDSFVSSISCTQELLFLLILTTYFLTVQRSTAAIGIIYSELFGKSRTEFISELTVVCCVAELRYVRDMVYPLVKKKLNQNNLGQLTERRTGANIKENLLKDVYN